MCVRIGKKYKICSEHFHPFTHQGNSTANKFSGVPSVTSNNGKKWCCSNGIGTYKSRNQDSNRFNIQ